MNAIYKVKERKKGVEYDKAFSKKDYYNSIVGLLFC